MTHILQLFDSHRSAALALAQFVRTGLTGDEKVILIARNDDWSRAAVVLAAEKVDLTAAVESGQLVIRESLETLASLLVAGMPSEERFKATVERLVEYHAADGQRLRCYGDMVDLLAAEGQFDAAQRLEQLWNDLLRRQSFALFCGYSSAHFAEATPADSLQRIRALHSHEDCASDDFLAGTLMSSTSVSNQGLKQVS